MLARLTPFRSVSRRFFLKFIPEEAIDISEYFWTRYFRGLVASLMNNSTRREVEVHLRLRHDLGTMRRQYRFAHDRADHLTAFFYLICRG